jgi:hypothetical protein
VKHSAIICDHIQIADLEIVTNSTQFLLISSELSEPVDVVAESRAEDTVAHHACLNKRYHSLGGLRRLTVRHKLSVTETWRLQAHVHIHCGVPILLDHVDVAGPNSAAH